MQAPSFRVLHALRIKGFGGVEAVAELAGTSTEETEQQMVLFQEQGSTRYRESRSLWQLTPEGRDRHARALADDIAALDMGALAARYREFLGFDRRLKTLFGDWQLRDGQPNDHSDRGHDASVIDRLQAENKDVQRLVADLGAICPRIGEYGPRLDEACRRVASGETKMLTGVMCGSYHDVWMELHEDLILTQGLNRDEEGST